MGFARQYFSQNNKADLTPKTLTPSSDVLALFLMEYEMCHPLRVYGTWKEPSLQTFIANNLID